MVLRTDITTSTGQPPLGPQILNIWNICQILMLIIWVRANESDWFSFSMVARFPASHSPTSLKPRDRENPSEECHFIKELCPGFLHFSKNTKESNLNSNALRSWGHLVRLWIILYIYWLIFYIIPCGTWIPTTAVILSLVSFWRSN